MFWCFLPQRRFLWGDWLLLVLPSSVTLSVSQSEWTVESILQSLRAHTASPCMMSPLIARLLLLVCLALPLYGVEKVRNRGYRKDPDADKVREISYNYSVAVKIITKSRYVPIQDLCAFWIHVVTENPLNVLIWNECTWLALLSSSAFCMHLY